MALVVGTNSWVTVVEADAYLSYRISAEDWFTLADTPATPGADAKDSMLISAYMWITAYRSISATSTDDNVKNAQIEAALFLSEHYDEVNDRRAAIATGVREFKYSRRREFLDYRVAGLPAYIQSMLRDYGTKNTTVVLKGQYDG